MSQCLEREREREDGRDKNDGVEGETLEETHRFLDKRYTGSNPLIIMI